MSKLKNIIKQLSNEDYTNIHDNLIFSGADKSAHLLKFMREKQLSDTKIMEELDVNTNAYYTLRSRLNQKIEEHLLQQMENPRTDLLKKVSNISEIIYTKKRAISVATLKKLEKELIDYDLSNELTMIYKLLKRLNINHEDHFYYKQLYNKHIAYMLALDKAEDLLADYFRKYGHFFLTKEENIKFELVLLFKEIINVGKLYQSHRLYVYQSAIYVFHRLFVDENEDLGEEEEPIEDILLNVEKIFETYYLDSNYYHLKIVFEYLKLEYYNHYKVYKKAEKYYEDVNNNIGILISNYSLFTFPPQALLTKLSRSLRLDIERDLYEENKRLFDDMELDINDLPKTIIYQVYRALCCFYIDKYDEASKWLNKLLNEVSFKKYPHALVEVKLLLLLQYCMMDDFDLFNQLLSSIQRQLRALETENVEQTNNFIKLLKVSLNESGKIKAGKLKNISTRVYGGDNSFSLLNYIKIDDRFLQKLL